MFLRKAILQVALVLAAYAQSFRAPRGLYTPRNWTTSTVNLKLNFLDDGTVKYNILFPQVAVDTLDSFPVSMLGSNIIASRVPQFRIDEWLDLFPGAFEELGLRIFFYDPIRNRITVNAQGRTFDIAHTSDPSTDLTIREPIKRPNGIYKSIEQGLDVMMNFDGDQSRVMYHIKLEDREYQFPFGVDFTMRSYSLIATFIPQNQLYGLHGRFPGLSTDYFYTNLGYDAENDHITFLLDGYRIVNLTRVPDTRSLVEEQRPESPVDLDPHTLK